MPDENVAFVLEGFRRYEQGERDVRDDWHENGVLTGPPGWPEQGPFEGREAVQGQFDRLSADYAETRIDDVEVVAERGEWVVVRFTWRTRGQASDIETAADMAAALRVRDGRFLEQHYRWDTDKALEAAGLAEESDA